MANIINTNGNVANLKAQVTIGVPVSSNGICLTDGTQITGSYPDNMVVCLAVDENGNTLA